MERLQELLAYAQDSEDGSETVQRYTREALGQAHGDSRPRMGRAALLDKAASLGGGKVRGRATPTPTQTPTPTPPPPPTPTPTPTPPPNPNPRHGQLPRRLGRDGMCLPVHDQR